ncbi:hypothetical protein ACQKM9_20655 [Viridibacillus sp. NPDC093762]|uniref:hypothetical protein n=1 Tax=Viridibacillus sp. NPDC093762 TaxID=3390720 RepID=UPI003D003F12
MDYRLKKPIDEEAFNFKNLNSAPALQQLTIYVEEGVNFSHQAQKLLKRINKFPIYMNLEIFDFMVEEIEAILIQDNIDYLLEKMTKDLFQIEIKIMNQGTFDELFDYMGACASYGRHNFYSIEEVAYTKEYTAGSNGEKKLHFIVNHVKNLMLITIGPDGESIEVVSDEKKIRLLQNYLK